MIYFIFQIAYFVQPTEQTTNIAFSMIYCITEKANGWHLFLIKNPKDYFNN